MKASNRVVVNTVAQYIKTFINIILSLYATRLILQTLGVDDFGIYTLLAGVISMLSFATNALAITTQRFLSYHQGKSNIEEQKNIFANSFYIHIVLAFITLTVLLLLTPLLFDGFLNINSERIEASITTYVIVSFILLITFLSTPFRAVLISHENIVFLTVIDVLDCIFKLLMAIGLSYITYDKLITYSLMMFFIQTFNLLVIGGFSMSKYQECILPSIKRLSKTYIKDIASFAIWTIYSIGCVIGRTQGIAIVINKFFGSAVNAAYGLGFQISGYVNFMSESLLNALKPQIMRAEGEGDRIKMLRLSEITSKYSFFLLSCLAIPCIVEMEALLTIWLGNVPAYAVLFCRMVLLASLADACTCGLLVANQAIGNVREYSIVVTTIKLITLPAVLICIFMGAPVWSIPACYVGFEFLCALLRIPFVAKTGNLNVVRFINNVFIKLMIPTTCLCGLCYITSDLFSGKFSFVFTFVLPNILYILLFYFFGMNSNEKVIFKSIIHKY